MSNKKKHEKTGYWEREFKRRMRRIFQLPERQNYVRFHTFVIKRRIGAPTGKP